MSESSLEAMGFLNVKFIYLITHFSLCAHHGWILMNTHSGVAFCVLSSLQGIAGTQHVGLLSDRASPVVWQMTV